MVAYSAAQRADKTVAPMAGYLVEYLAVKMVVRTVDLTAGH
jgi:hypothetical protein